MSIKRHIKTLAMAVSLSAVTAIVLASCGGGSPSATTTAPKVPLNGAGATFPQPLYSTWFSKYHELTGIEINYQGIGSGGGIQQITAGTVDFGASDGIMTAEQQAAAEAAYGPILHIPMTMGAVAIIYNVPGVSGLKLTPDVLADIYLGKITKWNDPRITAINPGVTFPATDIATVHRSDASGTTYIFTNYLSKVSTAWASGPGNATSVSWPVGIGGKGSAGVAGQVQQVPNSIGYVELVYAIQNNLPTVVLKNKSGNYIAPGTAATTAAAEGVTLPDDMKIMLTDSGNPQAYPIVGFTWILAYVNQTDQTKGEELAQMLWWAIHDGQQYTTPLDYAPLSSAAVAKAENLVRSIKYNGKPLVKS